MCPSGGTRHARRPRPWRPTSSVKLPAASTSLDHPRTVYLRQADLLPHLDGWLTGLFDPANLDATLDALTSCRRVHRGW